MIDPIDRNALINVIQSDKTLDPNFVQYVIQAPTINVNPGLTVTMIHTGSYSNCRDIIETSCCDNCGTPVNLRYKETINFCPKCGGRIIAWK